MAFTSRFYQPSNMVFFVLGDFNFQKIVRQVEKLLVDLPLVTGPESAYDTSALCTRAVGCSQGDPSGHGDDRSRGYNAYDDKRTAFGILLNNILGGPGMNSRLNVSLRERRDWSIRWSPT